jgi:steroid 5-alpha reductase family enzyme
MLSAFLTVLALMVAVMVAAYLTQRRTGNAGWIDVFWTFGTGASCVIAALWPAPASVEARTILVAALAALWAARLGSYILVRVRRSPKEDTRYARLRKEWGKDFQRRLFQLAFIQTPTTALLSLSVFVAAHGGENALGIRDLTGALVLLVAIGGEGLADEQMRAFKAEANHGAVMDRGLWGWSRHPNYFFEWLGWVAYPLIAFNGGAPVTWLTLTAPVLMYVILRYGTGVRILERMMLESRGDAFRAYQARVATFFPWPPNGHTP